MAKATLFESSRLLVGLNAFEPGQEHGLHAHAGQDKVYLVLEGSGLFLPATCWPRLRAWRMGSATRAPAAFW
jgi:oxalate decarboxylase/phosphoglucose isomerase-like protein (cupin superfamily)